MVGAAAAGLCHFFEDEIKQVCEMGEKIVVTGGKSFLYIGAPGELGPQCMGCVDDGSIV